MDVPAGGRAHFYGCGEGFGARLLIAARCDLITAVVIAERSSGIRFD